MHLVLSVDFASWTWPALLTLRRRSSSSSSCNRCRLILLYFFIFSAHCLTLKFEYVDCTQCMRLLEVTAKPATSWGAGSGVGSVRRATAIAFRVNKRQRSAALYSLIQRVSAMRRRRDLPRRWSWLALPQLRPAVFFFRLGHVRDRDKKSKLYLDASVLLVSCLLLPRERERKSQVYVIIRKVLKGLEVYEKLHGDIVIFYIYFILL